MAILQSNYLPWKGYFDIINMVDMFVFYDDVQYTVRDWRNRNIIKTLHGPKWITIPCGAHRNRLISEVRLPDNDWRKKHWSLIAAAYRSAPYFSRYQSLFEEIFMQTGFEYLSDFNHYVIKRIAGELLPRNTCFEDSRKYHCTQQKTFRLLEILDAIGNVGEYVTGPKARGYLREKEFSRRGIIVRYVDYTGYPEYNQLYPTATHMGGDRFYRRYC